jgi:hypothetical protein
MKYLASIEKIIACNSGGHGRKKYWMKLFSVWKKLVKEDCKNI